MPAMNSLVWRVVFEVVHDAGISHIRWSGCGFFFLRETEVEAELRAGRNPVFVPSALRCSNE